MQIYVACAKKPQFSYWTNQHTHIRSYKHPTQKNLPKSTKIRTFSHAAHTKAAPEHALAAFQLSVINLTFCVSLFVCWGDRSYFRLPILTVTTNSGNIETHLFQVITEQKNQKKRQFESQSTKNAESCVDRVVHHTHIHA